MFTKAEYLPCGAAMVFPQSKVTATLNIVFRDYIADGVQKPDKADCLVSYGGNHIAQSFSKLVNHIEGVRWNDFSTAYFASSAASAAFFEEVLEKTADEHVVVATEDGYLFIEMI